MCHILLQSYGHTLEKIQDIDNMTWPTVDKSALIQDEIKIVVQVNGKLRGNMIISSDETEIEIKEKAIEVDLSKNL